MDEMSEDGGDFVAGLAATLTPVRARRPGAEAALLALLGAAQLVGFAWILRTVPFEASGGIDLSATVAKAAALGLGAAAMSALALASLSPGARDARGPALLAAGLVLAALLAGLDWSAAQPAMPGKEGTLVAPRDGVRCFTSALTLGLPVALALMAFARSAAPTRPALTGALIGAAGGLWGGFVYAAQCPYVSVLYVTLWYGLAALTGAVAGRRLLGPRLRW